MFKRDFDQIANNKEVMAISKIIPFDANRNLSIPEDSYPFGLIRQVELNALCCIVNEGGTVKLKFYDTNGKLHDSIFSLIIASINNNNRKIDIEYENKKISLVDSVGNVVIQSDIDPKLLVRLSETNLKIEEVCPELTNPEAIGKIINSDGLKSILDKHMPVVSMEAKDISAAPIKLASTGGNVDASVGFKPDGK